MQIPPVYFNCYFNPFGKQIHYQKTSTVDWIIQVGCFYDICFRLADSLPQSVLKIKARNAEIIRNNSEEGNYAPDDARYLALAEMWINRNYGECLLRIPQIHDLVAKEILSHDEIECQIGAFVIMGNHIHLILKMLGGYSPFELISGIKNNTAREMNKILGRTGHRWMTGEYNHIVRSPQDLRRRLKYLKENPKGLNIPVYERPDDMVFSQYETPPEEKASDEQVQYYTQLWMM